MMVVLIIFYNSSSYSSNLNIGGMWDKNNR
jgi:hypothetical protein